jgi:16S rRNA (uracil1498-N3)-methyltransferase
MEIRRIFIDKPRMKNGMFVLTGPQLKYVATVIRKEPGDRVDLLDGKGYLYHCLIQAIRGKELFLQVVDVEHNPGDKRPKITLAVSPIKGPRMDWLVEKATELGVDRILPTIFKRTVVRIDEKDTAKRERWRKIAVEASRQAGRFTVPEVLDPIPLRGLLPFVDGVENRWTLWEREKSKTLKDIVREQKEGAICLVIGPEGGIEESEIAWMTENHFVPCSLGGTIFRSETAPLVVLSVINYECCL